MFIGFNQRWTESEQTGSESEQQDSASDSETCLSYNLVVKLVIH